MRRSYYTRRLLLLVLILVVLQGLIAMPVHAQNYLGKIRVQIKDFYSDRPLSGATILITPNNYTGKANFRGEALIEEIVPFRNYQIRAELRGYIRGKQGLSLLMHPRKQRLLYRLKRKLRFWALLKNPAEFYHFCAGRCLMQLSFWAGRMLAASSLRLMQGLPTGLDTFSLIMWMKASTPCWQLKTDT